MAHSIMGGETPNPEAQWQILQNNSVINSIPKEIKSYAVIRGKELLQPSEIKGPSKDQAKHTTFNAVLSNGTETYIEFITYHSGTKKGTVLIFLYFSKPDSNIFSDLNDTYVFPGIISKYSYIINNDKHFRIIKDKNGVPAKVLLKKSWEKQLVTWIGDKKNTTKFKIKIPAKTEFVL